MYKILPAVRPLVAGRQISLIMRFLRGFLKQGVFFQIITSFFLHWLPWPKNFTRKDRLLFTALHALCVDFRERLALFNNYFAVLFLR